MARKNNNHLKRVSYYDISEHIVDDIKNYGFDYQGKLFEKSVSNLYFQDPKKSRILALFDGMMSHVIDRIKLIKKFRNYAMDKNYTKFR